MSYEYRPTGVPKKSKKYSSLFPVKDFKDYKRTIAGRGDTHALDGGQIPFGSTKRAQQLRKITRSALLPGGFPKAIAQKKTDDIASIHGKRAKLRKLKNKNANK